MKICKTPYKWRVTLRKNDHGGSRFALKTDDLGTPKKPKRLENRGRGKRKEEEEEEEEE